MKKLKIIFILLFIWLAYTQVSATAPEINCIGLPFCDQTKPNSPSTNAPWDIDASALISEFIKYTAVVAVIALMISGVMYLLSGWEDEKIKKAKSWITWSLVWVLLSISAWSIIRLLNTISF